MGFHCGHQEMWPHYATMYLWHEILHDFFPLDKLSHALILFLTVLNWLSVNLGDVNSSAECLENLCPLQKDILHSCL